MRGSVIATSLLAAAVVLATPAAAQPRGDDDSVALVAAGRSALTRGDLGGAAKALDQALALNPRRIEAYVLRAAVYAARGEAARGVELMRKARALAPDNDDVAIALGTQLMLAGDVAEGVPLLEAAAARVPDRYEAHALLGHHYADRARWRDAVVALEAYRRTRPAGMATEDDRHALDLAEAYLRTRKAEPARAMYEDLARRHPTWMTARLGLAWATAAVDCRRARPLLAKLADDPAAPPTVWLVDGQCAIELREPGDAMALGRRYLEREPDSAPALALIGEAEAARGDLAAARASLTRARALEPARARYAVRLARVLRAAGDDAAAVAELEPLAVPPESIDFRSYWIEFGEALIAVGRGPAMLDRLRQALATAPDDAELATTVGAAQLAAGDAVAAAATLEHALAVADGGGGARTRTRLAQALIAIAEAALAADDVATAEPALVRADAVASSPPVWRGLGMVRLARGDAAGAIEVLSRAKLDQADDVTLILLGRAQAARGDVGAARAALDRAAAIATGPRQVDVALERAAFELERGTAAAAVDALTAVPADERKAAGARLASALVTARHAAGLAALADGQAARALGLLDEAGRDAAGDQAVAIRCDAALAAVASGDRDRALGRLKAIAKLRCPFPAPADTQAVPILTAFVDGLNPRRAGKAADKLAGLTRTATGVPRALAASALRVVAMTAAEQAYRAGKLPAARKHLATARGVESRAGADELTYDLAALDLADGKLAEAKAAFARVAARVPEALVGAGIVADREGDSAKALELWRQAKKAGAKLSGLDEWIAAKERIFGGGR
ncbi:MAG: tetratricopeptide repeat protein [Myxococcales bacterium]|nr:tetratricopeptide repeat protein [Myxococcales bacterium]